MQSVNFNIIRSNDREMIEALKAMVANGKDDVAPQSFTFSFLSDGELQIAVGEFESHEKLKAIISDNVRVFRSIRIDTPLGIISIQRHGQPANHDNTQPFDSVSVGPGPTPHPKAEELARLVSFAQQYLGRFSINALESYLGEDAKLPTVGECSLHLRRVVILAPSAARQT